MFDKAHDSVTQDPYRPAIRPLKILTPVRVSSSTLRVVSFGDTRTGAARQHNEPAIVNVPVKGAYGRHGKQRTRLTNHLSINGETKRYHNVWFRWRGGGDPHPRTEGGGGESW